MKTSLKDGILTEIHPFTQACPPFLGLCRRLHRRRIAAACIPGPRVDAGDLEAEVPGAGVLALPLGPRAHAVPVRLAVLPPAAVRPAVVKVEPPARHVQLRPRHAGRACRALVLRGGREGGGWSGDGITGCLLSGQQPTWIYMRRGISWINGSASFFKNLHTFTYPFLPLSPLWCKFQNKTGTEPLT